jgi:hypothetical protein
LAGFAARQKWYVRTCLPSLLWDCGEQLLSLRHHRDQSAECDNHAQASIQGKVPKQRCRSRSYFAHISNEQEPKFKSFLLIQGGMQRIALCQGARRVFTVTLNFHFLCIIGIRTVVAAIGVEIGDVTAALLIRAFVFSTHIENFCHYPPQCSDFCFDLS